MEALVLNAVGRRFDFENVDIVRASGLCHTDLLFAAHEIVPTPAVLGHEVAGIVDDVGPEVRATPHRRSPCRFSSPVVRRRIQILRRRPRIWQIRH